MEEDQKKKIVSYSKYAVWFKCPYHFYLDNVRGLRVFEDSIATCFGDAIHEPLQLYVEKLYKEGTKAADDIDLFGMFKELFKKYLTERKVEHTDDEFTDYVYDGDDIIKAFTNFTNRMKFFPSGKYEFIGVEDEILMPIKNNVMFTGFIDIILKEKVMGRYRIIDLKTSSREWNKWQKEDPAKYSQVLLYKAFYSKKYNIPLGMIDVEFLILKRKLLEGVTYPQSHIQFFVPRNNNKAILDTLETFSQFVGECFKPDGTFVEDLLIYPKIPGKAKKHCKYCPHKKVNCDAKSDVPESELE
jgi:hypothetical protein